jgi:hypothetical protein
MEELLKQFWPDLMGRVHGPFAFRFILQPLSAALIACRAGLRDARSGRPAYGWEVLTNAPGRKDLLREAWRELTKVFLIAVAIDLIYEVVVLREIHPVQSLVVAAVLALLPYPLFRGVVNRIVRWRKQGPGRPSRDVTAQTKRPSQRPGISH